MTETRVPLTYCSFATDDRCLGVLILNGALSPVEAAAASWLLGLNPGGELLALPVPRDVSEADYAILIANRHRLITKEEARALFGARRLGDELN